MSLAERLVRAERTVLIAGIIVLAGLAWVWLALGAGMREVGSSGMAAMPANGPASAFLILLMWWVMMIAMMLPSAAPAILLYGVVRRRTDAGSAIGPSWLFLSGYMLAWFGVSCLAAVAQLALTRTGAIDGMSLRAASPLLAGATLVAAGLYQLAPVKDACLTHCRSPASFFALHWRPGAGGALRLGLLHGFYCVGCCWLLMALLFVGGVMNFAWIAALVALVAVEKLVRRGPQVGRIAGIVLIAWGVARVAGA